MTVLDDAAKWARENGYDTAVEFGRRDGRTVYVLLARGAVGLPRFLRPTPFGFIESTDDEGMALLDEIDGDLWEGAHQNGE